VKVVDQVPQEPDADLGEEPAPPHVRSDRRRARARRRRNRRAFALTVAVLGALIPVLGYVGVKAVLDSRGGRLIQTSLDPADPGYEAIVEPTPVALVIHTQAGQLIGLTVLSLTSPDGGGSVMFVPPDTGTFAGTESFGFDRLRGAFAVAGVDGVVNSTAIELNAGFTETIEVDAARLAAMVAPVAPLRFANPDELEGVGATGEEVSFPDGSIEVAAEQVGDYLALTRNGESDLNRLVRHQVLWEAWIAAVAAAPDPTAAVPGEGGSGLGHFVSQLARGTVVYQTLPVVEVDAPEGGGVRMFEPIGAEMPGLISRTIPLPIAASPGSRVRVRILDGTGTAGAPQSIIEPLVRAGAQIIAIGNADRFTYAESEVRYDELQSDEESAQRMQSALGLGAIRSATFGTDAFDVTVIIGRDLSNATGEGAGTTD
jgi:hypothetical protein